MTPNRALVAAATTGSECSGVPRVNIHMPTCLHLVITYMYITLHYIVHACIITYIHACVHAHIHTHTYIHTHGKPQQMHGKAQVCNVSLLLARTRIVFGHPQFPLLLLQDPVVRDEVLPQALT